MKPRCLDAALAYLESGWAPLALCPPDHEGCSPAHIAQCTRPGKTPLYPWKTYQQRLPSQKEVRIYFNRWPTANVGIILGQISQLVGLDIDGPEAMALLQSMAGDNIPMSVEFTTPGGGKRILYQTDQVVPRKVFNKGQSHLIILGEGSYTVMPPSLHANGRAYEWQN